MNHSRARDLLSAHLEQDLGDVQRSALEQHLAGCAVCAAELEALRRSIDLLRRLPDPEPPPFLATRVMARIAAGETRVPAWRRWLEPLGAPLVAAPLAAAAAALAVFSFAAPRPAPELALAAVEHPTGLKPAIVAREVGPVARPPSVVVTLPDPRLLARGLRGASHPHSASLAAHFDHPVRAVAYQPR